MKIDSSKPFEAARGVPALGHWWVVGQWLDVLIPVMIAVCRRCTWITAARKTILPLFARPLKRSRNPLHRKRGIYRPVMEVIASANKTAGVESLRVASTGKQL